MEYKIQEALLEQYHFFYPVRKVTTLKRNWRNWGKKEEVVTWENLYYLSKERVSVGTINKRDEYRYFDKIVCFPTLEAAEDFIKDLKANEEVKNKHIMNEYMKYGIRDINITTHDVDKKPE